MRIAVVLSLVLIASTSAAAREPGFSGSKRSAEERWDDRAAVEQKHLRTRHAKHYRLPSGRFLAEITAEPQHYQSLDGTWRPIRLEFRDDAATGDLVADGNTLRVRSERRGIHVVDAAGRGVRWITRDRPVADTRPAHGGLASDSLAAASLSVREGSLLWTYELTPTGIKSGAIIDSPQGPRTYRFPYEILGLDEDFVTDDRGNAVLADVLFVPAPVVLAADGETYPAGHWSLADVPGGGGGQLAGGRFRSTLTTAFSLPPRIPTCSTQPRT